jgi:hypothetical protein
MWSVGSNPTLSALFRKDAAGCLLGKDGKCSICAPVAQFKSRVCIDQITGG